ncbi:MAG: ATP-binding protein, partial [Bacteroidota bacterium]
YPGQLNQVFMNILNNAVQAMPEEKKDAEITIYTEEADKEVMIRMKDNGIGIPDEIKNRIWEPFFTTKEVGVGTGLGMSITYGIIEKHGGKIELSSEVGKGTEFVITLPKKITPIKKKESQEVAESN